MSAGKLRVWLVAARPKTLWAGIAPVIMGTAMAVDDGVFHALSALAALVGSVLIQVGTNYANDYFDFVKGTDTDERLGPARATQTGLVTPAEMKRATMVVFAAALIVGAYLVWRGGWPIVAIGLSAIACGVLYTGGPFPLGYLGIADVFVLVFFGPVAVAGTYWVQARSIDAYPLIAGLAPGLLSVALLTVNNLRDVDGDAEAGKKTLAVRFGPAFAKVEYLFCVLAACAILPLVLCLATRAHWLSLAGCGALALAFVPAHSVLRVTGPELNKTLAATGKMLLLFSVLWSAGWLL